MSRHSEKPEGQAPRLGTLVWFTVAIGITSFGPCSAQPSESFRSVFNEILASIHNADGSAADPFGPSVGEVDANLVPAINSLLSRGVSGFPLSASIVGSQFSLGAGGVTRPLGPIYTEVARSVGRHNLIVGTNYTFIDFSRLRGESLEELVFRFTIQNLDDNTERGNVRAEREILEVQVRTKFRAHLTAVFVAFGVTPNIELGAGLPLVYLETGTGAVATLVNGRAVTQLEGAPDDLDWFFEGERLSSRSSSIQESLVGLGDIALRIKLLPTVELSRRSRVGLLTEVRLPTGSAKNFTGTDNILGRVMLIHSAGTATLSHHLNLALQCGRADHTQFQFASAIDVKLRNNFDVLLEFLGRFDLEGNDQLAALTNSEKLQFGDVRRSNVPDGSRDHSFTASIGLKYAPTKNFVLFANALVPQTDRGLGFDVAPTFGGYVSL